MPQLPAIGEEVRPVTAAPALPAIGAEVPQATFHSTNLTDEQGNPVVAGATDFAREFAHQINPVPLGQMIPFPKAAGGAGLDAPVQVVKGMGAAQGELFNRAKASYQRGDYVGAFGHFVNYLLPIAGPILDDAGNKLREGKTGAGLGETLGFAASLFGPKMVGDAIAKAKAIQVKTPALVKETPNLTDQAALRFAEQHGIPVDAATATGSRSVAAVQAVADTSPIGGFVKRGSDARTAAALTQTADELASRAHPSPVSPEQSAAGVRSTLGDLRNELHESANTAYETLRGSELGDAAKVDVPAPDMTPAQLEARNVKMSDTLGHVPAPSELAELRRIEQELDNWRFTKRTWNWHPEEVGKKGNAAGGDATIVAGSGGAPVYHDITERMPYEAKLGPDGKPIAKGEIYKPTRAEVQASIKKALDTGTFDKPAQGALEVVRGRMSGDRTLSTPTLPPSAGDVPVRTQPMAHPVDLRDVKGMIKPVVEQLRRQLPETQQKANPGLHAMQGLLDGPDFAPLSQVDRDLSTIKGLARKHGGVAKFVASRLHDAVNDAAAAAGPEVASALERGRSATKAKYAVEGLIKKLRTQGTEPVQAFRQLTAAGDANINLLRQLEEVAPADLRKVGRAVLDELTSKATAKGGFDRGAGLSRDWRKLGPETKKILFPDKGHVEALDNFFHLADRLSSKFNTSESATTVASAGEVIGAILHPVSGVPIIGGTGALSALLHSPAAVKALTRGLSLELKLPATASKAARAAVAANIAKAYELADVPLPKAASDESKK